MLARCLVVATLFAAAGLSVADSPVRKLDRFIGVKSNDMLLSPPPGLRAAGEGMIVDREGYVLATTDDKHRVLLLDQSRRLDKDHAEFTVEAVVEVPAKTAMEDITVTCTVTPVVAILAPGTPCGDKSRKPLFAWRVAAHNLQPVKTSITCTKACVDEGVEGGVPAD